MPRLRRDAHDPEASFGPDREGRGLLASNRFVVRDGVKYDHSGQYAAFGFFAYTGHSR